MSWFVLVILSVLFGSSATLTQRVLMKSDKSDPVAYMVVFQFLTTGIFGSYLLFTGLQIPNIVFLLPNILLSGVLIAIASLTMFQALKLTEASEYTIINTSGVFWSLISSAIFLNEIISTKKILGTLLIISAIIIIAWKKSGKLKLHKGHLYTLISATAFSLAFTNDAFILKHLEVMAYLFIIFFLPGIIMLLLKPKSVLKMKTLIKPSQMLKMLLFSILYAFSAFTFFSAYKSGGDVSQIYPISKSSIIITVILATIFLKERKYLFKKLIATAVAFMGVLLLK